MHTGVGRGTRESELSMTWLSQEWHKLERAWLAASAGSPINPLLKRQLLHKLYSFDYEPFHAVGEYVLFNDAQNNYGWPEDTQL